MNLLKDDPITVYLVLAWHFSMAQCSLFEYCRVGSTDHSDVAEIAIYLIREKYLEGEVFDDHFSSGKVLFKGLFLMFCIRKTYKC